MKDKMKKLRPKKFVTTNLTPKKITVFLLGTAAAAFFALVYSLIVLIYSGAALLLHRQDKDIYKLFDTRKDRL